VTSLLEGLKPDSSPYDKILTRIFGFIIVEKIMGVNVTE